MTFTTDDQQMIDQLYDLADRVDSIRRRLDGDHAYNSPYLTIIGWLVDISARINRAVETFPEEQE